MDSDAAKTMEALINALVIIAFIATITFVVVFLYKFNCMKVKVDANITGSPNPLIYTGSGGLFDVFFFNPPRIRR